MSKIHYFKEKDGDMYTYHAISDDANEKGGYPDATVTTIHNRGRFIPTYDQNTGNLSQDYVIHKYYNGDLYNFSGNLDHLRGAALYGDEISHKNVYDNPEMHTGKLFETVSEPRTLLTSMFAHPSMRVSAMTLGKMAADDALGGKLVASDSLSKHSSRLTRHAIDMGFPVTPHPNNPNAEVTNSYDFDEPNNVSYFSPEMRRNMVGVEPIPQSVTDNANKELREMIKNGRKRNTKPATAKGLSDQFVIPGMEGFI